MTSEEDETATREQIVRFGAAVRARRKALGLRQEDVHEPGDDKPSTTTLGKLENGTGPAPSRKTLAGIEAGLRLQPNSARRSIYSGELYPLPDSDREPFRTVLAAAPAEYRGGTLRRLQLLRDELDQIIADYRNGKDTFGEPRI